MSQLTTAIKQAIKSVDQAIANDDIAKKNRDKAVQMVLGILSTMAE
jgi:hypothetical protein